MQAEVSLGSTSMNSEGNLWSLVSNKILSYRKQSGKSYLIVVRGL